MQKRLFSIAIAILCLLVALPASAAFTKREFRGSWISNAWALDWPSVRGTSSDEIEQQKAELIQYLNDLQGYGFNVAFFQVRSMCDAAYPSSYAPWTSYVSGTRGVDPGWDPLGFAVEEAHKRGIELHAWLNPYRWANSDDLSFWSTNYDTAWKNAGYLITSTSSSITSLDPGNSKVIEHIVNVVKEICTNYKVDGIVFDDYFYPNYYDKDASTATKNQYRANVNKMVESVYNAVKDTRPEARFGISPAGVAYWGASAVGVDYSAIIEKEASDWQYDALYSDPLAWLAAGNIDYISPQIYWNTNNSKNPFGTITTWWNGVAEKFGRHHFPSHNCAEQFAADNSYTMWQEFEKQINYTRASSNTPGAVMYRQTQIGLPLTTSEGVTWYGFQHFLKVWVFNKPALAPEVTWRNTGKTYTTVQNLSLSGSTLSWSSAAQGNEVLKYTVYAIPNSLTYEDVLTTDGISNTYLQGITYNTSFDVISGDYWYAVCILDGLSHEYEPQFLGVAESENTTLTSPVNGAVAYGKFTWAAVDNATYTLEISASSDFSSIALSQSGITTNSATISLSSLLSSSTYYWRVKTRQTGTTEVVSDVASFTTPAYSPEQMDEAIYSSNGSMEFENLWMRKGDGNLDNFTPNYNFCRDMALDKDYMYIICRESNSATSACYIEKYDINTGEKRGTLNISFPESSISYFPANNIFLDDAGNVCVSNLTLDCSTSPLLIHSIDMTTGVATLRASIATNDVVRFDHCDVLGDVVAGDFYVFAATSYVANSEVPMYIYRWYYENGERVVNNSYKGTPAAYVPSSATHFGAAPRIKAITKDKVIVDGQTTALTQYDISISAPTATSFADANLLPSTYNTNGFDWFKLDVNDVIVYNFADYSNGIKFNTAITGSVETDFGTAVQLGDWTFPREGLGSANSANYTAEVDHYSISDTEVLVGVYATGNGMGVYRIKKTKDIGTGIDDALLDALTLVKSGCTITLSRPAARVEIYNMAGAKVAEKQNVASFSTYLQPGAYIIRAIDNSGNIATKTIIF
ncbi:MAG: family 10 glycosylhydrolase [Muribaculaceae bacterium]